METDDDCFKGAETLPHGVILLRDFLSSAHQETLVLECLELSDPKQLDIKSRETYTPMFMLNWPQRYSGIAQYLDASTPQPKVMGELGRQLMQTVLAHGLKDRESGKADHLPPRLKCPSKYEASALRAVMYPEGSCLAPHQDMHMGWVLTVSIGCDCDFYFSTNPPNMDNIENDCKPDERVRLSSGDVIFMQGQVLHHGVTAIYPDTAPEFWRRLNEQGALPEDSARLNVQYRDASVIQKFGFVPP